ncbi:Leucine Rich Repeat family protein [Klebsormidium nitens]|uniref:Leucine Rich Repeat family protein n=1 Tax=Klebsormidium nitens TaxID=105231 RepID=A0A1Y1HH97_KLENI|nr:Leucine Rich Repeat family protein [Klebsormidium nitens]|eukprot:GAQ77814.1 Leucine Rich Repeat family protein [Klebsormidium nitens]
MQPESLEWREQQPEIHANLAPAASNPFASQESQFAKFDISDDVIPTPDEPERRGLHASYAQEGYDESRSEWRRFEDDGYEQLEAEQHGIREHPAGPGWGVLGDRQSGASQPPQTPHLNPVVPIQEAEAEPQGRRKGYKCGICGQPKKGHACQGRVRDSDRATEQATAPSLPSTPLLEQGFSQPWNSSNPPSCKAADTPRHHPPRPERHATPPVEKPFPTNPHQHPTSLNHQAETTTPLHQTPGAGTQTQARPAGMLLAGGRSISRQLFQGSAPGTRMVRLRDAGSPQRPALPASSSSSKEGFRRPGQGARDCGVQTHLASHPSRRSGIHSLPESCLLRILAKLPPCTLALSALVSRRWHSCSDAIWPLVERADLVLNNGSPKPGQVSAALGASRHVTEVLQKCVGLRRLVLTVTGRIEDAVLSAIATCRPELTDLEIRVANNGVNVISGAAIGLLLARCQFLRVLKLDGCRCVSRVKVSSQTLTTLWLTGCDRLLFLEMDCPQMRELALDLIPPPGFGAPSAAHRDAAAATLLALLKQVRALGARLERFHLSSPFLSDRAVATIFARNFSNMRALSLTQAPELTDFGVDVIVRTCPNIELLDLSGSTVTDVGLHHLATRYAESLRSLLIAGCSKVTSDGLAAAVAGLRQLVLLDCGYVFTESTALSQRRLRQPLPDVSRETRPLTQKPHNPSLRLSDVRSPNVQTPTTRMRISNLQSRPRESPESRPHGLRNPQFRTPDRQIPNLQTPDPGAGVRRNPVAQRGALFQPGPQAAGIPRECADEEAVVASNRSRPPIETVDDDSPPEKKQKTQIGNVGVTSGRNNELDNNLPLFAEESVPPQELSQMSDTIPAPNPSLQSDPSANDPLQSVRPGELSIRSETLSKLSLWGCSDVRTLELECPALAELNLTSCTGLTPGNISLRCWGLARVHAAGCKGGVAEAIQEQVLTGHWWDSDAGSGSGDGSGSVGVKRQADGSKRVQALRQSPQRVALYSE